MWSIVSQNLTESVYFYHSLLSENLLYRKRAYNHRVHCVLSEAETKARQVGNFIIVWKQNRGKTYSKSTQTKTYNVRLQHKQEFKLILAVIPKLKEIGRKAPTDSKRTNPSPGRTQYWNNAFHKRHFNLYFNFIWTTAIPTNFSKS